MEPSSSGEPVIQVLKKFPALMELNNSPWMANKYFESVLRGVLLMIIAQSWMS